jgi:NSS family neurotransmitter:Na+ symporter
MRAKLGSRLGFLMVAAGCAVGLGNVWRFPFVVGQNGGAAFVLVYLVFLALMGFPLLLAELAVGRGARKGIASALGELAPKPCASAWRWVGRGVFMGNFVLMIYYTDVAGWLVKYTSDYARAAPKLADPAAAFQALTADRVTCTAFMCGCVLFAAAVCLAGVVKGVERATKVMMISLLALLVVLAVKAVSLPGAREGVVFYLAPDWGKFMAHPGKAVFDAMGQAFFTLSVGVGAMTIFGSYVGRERSLVTETVWIIAIDTFVALLSGLIVFPACAAYNVDVTAGPGLIFIALPKVFSAMPGGAAWGFFFFLFLSFAALTTIIAVFECIIGGMMDETGLRRVPASLLVAVIVAVCSMPCVLFESVLKWEDFVLSQLLLPIGGLALCLFVTRGWGWGCDAFRAEASAGAGWRLPAWFCVYMKWMLPFAILGLLAAGFLDWSK